MGHMDHTGCACISDKPSDHASEHTPSVLASHTDSACVTGKPADDAEAFWRIRQHAANGDDGLSNHVAGGRGSRSHRSNAQGRPSTAGTATTASVSDITVPQRSGSVPPHRQAAGQELTSPQTRGKCTLCDVSDQQDTALSEGVGVFALVLLACLS